MTTDHTDNNEPALEPCPRDLISFKWAETLSAGEQDVLLASSLRRLQNMINSHVPVAAKVVDSVNSTAPIVDELVHHYVAGKRPCGSTDEEWACADIQRVTCVPCLRLAITAATATAAPAEQSDDDYVAWCRYTYAPDGSVRSIVTCDSDSKGAFKVYRAPFPAAAAPVELNICSKCSHALLLGCPLDELGQCRVTTLSPDGDAVECGCKCECTAPVADTGDDEGEIQKLRQAIGWICDAADAAYLEDSDNKRIHEIFNIAAQAAGLKRRLPDEHGRFDETGID